jgi:uncharacterized membrane protein
MQGHEFQIISALATTLFTVVSGIVRVLLKRNEKLERVIDEHNETLRKNNEALASANAALIKAMEAATAPQQRTRS